MKRLLNKKFLFLLAMAVSVPSLADTHLFECKVKEEGQWVTVRFGVSPSLDPKKVRLEDVKGSKEYAPIAVEPEKLKSGHYSALNTLNGQGGDLRIGKTSLTLFGDDDGIQYVWLVLYKNSNYEKGFIRFQGPGGKEDDWYQKISCTHNVD